MGRSCVVPLLPLLLPPWVPDAPLPTRSTPTSAGSSPVVAADWSRLWLRLCGPASDGGGPGTGLARADDSVGISMYDRPSAPCLCVAGSDLLPGLAMVLRQLLGMPMGMGCDVAARAVSWWAGEGALVVGALGTLSSNCCS